MRQGNFFADFDKVVFDLMMDLGTGGSAYPENVNSTARSGQFSCDSQADLLHEIHTAVYQKVAVFSGYPGDENIY